jgi:hypothetical protein
LNQRSGIIASDRVLRSLFLWLVLQLIFRFAYTAPERNAAFRLRRFSFLIGQVSSMLRPASNSHLHNKMTHGVMQMRRRHNFHLLVRPLCA